MMVIRTDITILACEHESGYYCIHPKRRKIRMLCSTSNCPKLADAVQTLKEHNDFYFIEKLGIHNNE